VNTTTPARVEMLLEAARRSRCAVVLGQGGGSDCFLANLVASWLRDVGVERVLLGGVACQWWPVEGHVGTMVRTVGPEFYDPTQLEDVEILDDHAVLVGPNARLGSQVPHEATLAGHLGERTFVLSLRGGAAGASQGLRALIEYADADLVVSVDVGSDTLSTGNETRPVQTALADHITLAALTAQDVPAYFCLAGYGADAEMEIEELDVNFGRVLQAGGLRGAVVPSPAAIDEIDELHRRTADPIGSLIVRAYRGEFGLYRVLKESPWGQVAKLGVSAVPIWVLDPYVVVESVAVHVEAIRATTSVAEAQQIYLDLGRLPETAIARSLDFGRSSDAG
jgi:hypothetical protein